MYIDSHCHIHLSEFDADRDQVFARAHQVGVETFMIVGDDHATNVTGFELLSDRPDCFFSLGIHPHNVHEWNSEVRVWLEEKMQHPKVKAVGETGLDYFKTTNSKELQEKVFRAQIDLALQYQKPIVLHIRDAFSDAYRILSDYPKLKFIVHCFTGTADDIKWIVKLGGYISLSGIVTFSNAKELQAAVPTIPADRLLWETDSPFLSPGPFRGKRCEPSFVVVTAQKVADLYQTPLTKLAPLVLQNTKTIFGF